MKKLPTRDKVKVADTWDLSSLFPSDDAWEKAFKKWEKQVPKYESFRGTLADGPEALLKCLKFDSKLEREGGTPRLLRDAEDDRGPGQQHLPGHDGPAAARRHARGGAASFIRPELLAMSSAKLKKLLDAKALAPYRLMLERMVRYKPHTLTKGEERLLAMQAEVAGSAGQIFRQLTDADLKFGEVKNEKGEKVELNQSSFSVFLHSPKRAVRKTAFHQFYDEFADHENALAASLSASIKQDAYHAAARNYPSALESSLFGDNVRGGGLRQSCRGRALEAAGGLQVLRLAPPQDEAQGDPPLRHVRADPQRARQAAHVGPGGQGGRRVARAARQESTARRSRRGSRGAGAIATRTRARTAARSRPVRTKATRTS